MRKAILILPLLLLSSCIWRSTAVNLTPQEKLFAVTNATLGKVTQAYNELLPLAGEAYVAGLVDQKQLDKIQRAGEKVDASLIVAEDALAAYFRGQSEPDKFRAHLTLALATLPDLIDLMEECGVGIPPEVEAVTRAAIVMIDIVLEELEKEAADV